MKAAKRLCKSLAMQEYLERIDCGFERLLHDQGPHERPDFQKVVQTFLRTPPKPHKSKARKGAKVRKTK